MLGDSEAQKGLTHLIVTGVINNTVVTLSKNEDNTAVNKHRQLTKGHTFPLVIYVKGKRVMFKVLCLIDSERTYLIRIHS